MAEPASNEPISSSASSVRSRKSESNEVYSEISLSGSSIDHAASPAGLSLDSSQPSGTEESRTTVDEQPASSWRNTMNTFFTSKSPVKDKPERKTSSFLLNRLESPTAARDRRISRELGGGEKLREVFERVRGEMESAAKDMRQEKQDATEDEVDWAFWGAVVQDYEEVALTKPKDLSKAIQLGIPPVIRGAIWQLMSSSKDFALEETYKGLLKQTSTHEKAIAKDLHRTFPSHKFFQQGGGVGQESLFMVVKAYSLYDEDVGYTQGLAFIVAALLLNMPDEEAFCVLVRLMGSYNLRSHYLADMPGLQLRLFQLDRLLEDILPLLHAHLVRKGIKSSMYASQWFMTLFAYRFPLSLVARVFDIVFAEGIEAMFRFSLALLKKSEARLLELTEFEHVLKHVSSDLFEIYRGVEEDEWRANEFVRDAYEIRITPFMLDSYQQEYEAKCRDRDHHAIEMDRVRQEMDQLRAANRSLSAQVKQLEASLAASNREHVDLVKSLVQERIEKEETANELVRVKLQYAELAHDGEVHRYSNSSSRNHAS